MGQCKTKTKHTIFPKDVYISTATYTNNSSFHNTNFHAKNHGVSDIHRIRKFKNINRTISILGKFTFKYKDFSTNILTDFGVETFCITDVIFSFHKL
jgi:hypothetical protein